MKCYNVFYARVAKTWSTVSPLKHFFVAVFGWISKTNISRNVGTFPRTVMVEQMAKWAKPILIPHTMQILFVDSFSCVVYFMLSPIELNFIWTSTVCLLRVSCDIISLFVHNFLFSLLLLICHFDGTACCWTQNAFSVM